MNGRPDKRAIASWAFYDFANTIFSMNVISLYFALWVTVDHGGEDILYSIALSGSMLAVAISAPVFGTISDQTGRRRFPLILLTIISVFATALIGQAISHDPAFLCFLHNIIIQTHSICNPKRAPKRPQWTRVLSSGQSPSN